ncbi:MAG: FAD/NAD(P)-binding protein [Nostocaceae cyanobacterium]|nr:FAD/NAD(P)-binding protein [Nostocaceae cyanobacterium]
MVSKVDLAIIGAGPHALTLVTHLLQKRQKIRSKIAVFDPSGRWLSQWKQQFAALEIPHLRSPAVHHPDPNPFALRKFAESRPHELFPPYDLPGTDLFDDFCGDVIRRWDLENAVTAEEITCIEPLPHSLGPRLRLWLKDRKSIIARRVVLATGSSQPQIPDWVSQIQTPLPQDRLCHSQLIDLRKLQLAGERILIVGGGLTSGHLAMGALSRMAKVDIIIRRQLQEKIFDAEPGWLGPKYLKGFFAESDFQQRWRMIQSARNGGSITPAMGMQLRRKVRQGKVRIYENTQVVKAQWLGNYWLIRTTSGEEYEYDRIWLSTGTRFDVYSQPLLEEVLQAYPIPVVNGLPVLDYNLCWRGCPLFIMGGLAALQIGPTARNLSGARMASEKLQKAIIKSTVAPYQAKIA